MIVVRKVQNGFEQVSIEHEVLAIVIQMARVGAEDENIRIIGSIAGLKGIDVGHDHPALAGSHEDVRKLELYTPRDTESVYVQRCIPDVLDFNVFKILHVEQA